MTNFNKITFLGRLTRDPEMRYAQSGTAVTKFGMASDHTRGSGQDKKTETCFVDLVAFGKTAETIEKYMKKGQLFMVEGRLSYSTWEDKNGGGKRSKHEIVVEKFVFMPNDKRGEQKQETQPVEDYDDIPF